MGRIAAELLFARLEGARSPAGVHIIPSLLMRRGSGEIPAPKD
jgi:LacI family transcriptional regulator